MLEQEIARLLVEVKEGKGSIAEGVSRIAVLTGEKEHLGKVKQVLEYRLEEALKELSPKELRIVDLEKQIKACADPEILLKLLSSEGEISVRSYSTLFHTWVASANPKMVSN